VFFFSSGIIKAHKNLVSFVSPVFKKMFFGLIRTSGKEKVTVHVIQHCFICRPSDSTVSVDAGIEPRAVATLALTHLD
jgi:hypothetical protein